MKAPRDDGQDFLGDFGPFGALPAVIAFWFIVGAAWMLGSAAYDVLLATEALR